METMNLNSNFIHKMNLENSFIISCKVKHTPMSGDSKYLPKRNEHIFLQKDLNKNIYSSFTNK